MRFKKTIGAGILAIVGSVVAIEGGYVNHPKDPGGETNHGITKVVAEQHGYHGAMKDLTKEMAEEIYIEDYVVKPRFDLVYDLSPAVAHKLIDAGVNTGTGRASRWFQESLNNLNRAGRDYSQIAVDGSIGSGTLTAYTSLQRVRGKVEACKMTIKLIDAKQANHYTSLTNLKDFTPGWIINRIGNVPLSKCEDEK